MATIELHGRISEEGKLEVNLPEGLPVGDVKITIELPTPLTLNNVYEVWSPYDSFGAARTLRDLLENEECDQ